MSDRSSYDQARINRAHARAFLAWLGDARERSPKTVYQYGGRLESFLAHVGGRRLDALALSELEAWVTRPRRGGKRGAASTKQADVALLRSFYRYLIGHGLVAGTQDPSVLLQAPKVSNFNPKALDDETWSAVWSLPTLTDAERVMLGLGFLLGLRREEMCRLRPTNVALRRGQLVAFIRKGGGDDVLPFASCVALVADRLPHVLPDPDAFLGPLTALTKVRGADAMAWLLPWGEDAQAREAARCRGRGDIPEGMTNPDQINKRLGRLVERAGVDRFTPHALRHSFVTNMLRCDVPLHVVCRLANHSSPTVTMRYVKTAADPLADLLTETGRLVRHRWTS